MCVNVWRLAAAAAAATAVGVCLFTFNIPDKYQHVCCAMSAVCVVCVCVPQSLSLPHMSTVVYMCVYSCVCVRKHVSGCVCAGAQCAGIYSSVKLECVYIRVAAHANAHVCELCRCVGE